MSTLDSYFGDWCTECGEGIAQCTCLDGPENPEDLVNHPSHYQQWPVEVIEITEQMNFCLGNVIKYVLRADYKGRPVEDLKKARWYLDREIQRRTGKDA